MDPVFTGLLVLTITYPVLGLLAFKVGRWVERKEAQVKMLLAQVEELKSIISSADFKALAALRAYQSDQQEAENAKNIWSQGK